MRTSGSSEPRLRAWTGVGIGTLAAFCYALIVILAKLAYAGGSDPLTLVTARVLLFAIGLYLFLRVTGRQVHLPPRLRYASVAIGLIVGAQAFAYYSSINFIPVSLAVLFFATYPLQTALFARMLDRQPLPIITIGALLVAFAGVALALQVSAGPLDPRGILLALAGGTGMAIVIIGSHRILRTAPLLPMSCHITGSTALACAVALAATGGPALPSTTETWLALGAVPFVYVVAVLGFYNALPMIGPTRAAMLGNLESPFTLMLALLFLQEMLTPMQLFGAALVIGAVFVMQRSGSRQR